MDAPEELRQAVAQALHDATGSPAAWGDLTAFIRDGLLAKADAVLAVPAIAGALERDRKVAESMDAISALCGEVESVEAAWKRSKVAEVQANAVWMAHLAKGSSWPGEMAYAVEQAANRVIRAYGSEGDRAALDAIEAALYPDAEKPADPPTVLDDDGERA